MLKRQKIVAAAAVVLLSGCMQDGEPLGLEREHESEAVRGALRCQVDVRGSNLTCTPQQPAVPSGASGVILGGQGTHVLLQSTNVKYDAGTEVFSADVTVRNLLTQALGTADGESLHSDGVRVFFHTAPAVTGGTGVVTVKNADGTGVFTGSSAPYFEYAQVLSPGKVSLPRTWEWNVPSTIETFTFTVYVSAAAPQEDGVEAGLRIEASTITAGSGYSCGLTMDGKAYCWGRGEQGQLGNGSTAEQLTPVEVSAPPDTRFVSISAGGESTCAITTTGKAYCWGYGWFGQLGNGSTEDRTTPVAVDAPPSARFVSISAGGSHTCAVTSNGGAYCWGYNGRGKLGNGSTTDSSVPVAVNVPGGASFVSISAGVDHTCAITSTGAAYCWGYADNGRLGSLEMFDQSSPIPVSAPAGFVLISAGDTHSCGVTSTGAAYCWGSGAWGKMGNGAASGIYATPVLVSQPASAKFVSISVSYANTCAVTSTGAAYCWGAGFWGALGNGGTDDQSTPVAVTQPLGARFTSISAGGGHTCAVTSEGAAYCWGNGSGGMLGNGGDSQQNAPVPVSSVTTFAWLDLAEPADLAPGRTPFRAYARAERALRPLEASWTVLRNHKI